MKKKDQFIEKFKVFYALVEHETENKLTCIWRDNWEEYIGLFDNFYKEYDIGHEKTTSKTP